MDHDVRFRTCLGALFVLGLAGCASGGEGPGVGLGGGTPGGGGADGAGESTAVTTTATGFGGATSSSSAVTSVGSTGVTTTVSSSAGTGGGGNDARHTMVLLSAFGQSVMTGTFTTQDGWYMWPQQDPSTDGIAVAFTGLGAYALIRSQNGNGSLDWSIWSGQWGAFSPIAAGATTLAAPAMVGDAFNLYAVYQQNDSTFAYAEYRPGGWTVTAESLGAGAAQFGPEPPAIALAGGDPVIVYAGNDGDLYDRTRASGAWQAAHGHGLVNVTGTPALAALPTGPELLAVFADASSGQVRWTARTNGSWSAPADVPGLSSADPPSLAALPGGGALLAIRGVDTKLYTALFDATAHTWTVDSTFATIVLHEPPAVAPGIDANDAEIAFVDTGYILYHASLVGGAWTTAQFIGSGGERLALATGH
jgi:hypothetical protein